MAAPRRLSVTLLVLLLGLPLITPQGAAAGASYGLQARNEANYLKTDFQEGELIIFTLYVTAGTETVTVYRDLRITRVAPGAPTLVGSINDGSEAVQVPAGTTAVVRIEWDQIPTGAHEGVGPGRYRVAYLDDMGVERIATTVEIAWQPDLQVTSLEVSSAPLPPPLSPTAPYAPQPVTKRIRACIHNAGPEYTMETGISFYHRSNTEDPTVRHVVGETQVRFDSTYPPCPTGPGTLVQFDWALPLNASERSVVADTILALADPKDKIPELVETNNARTTTFAVYDRCEFTWAGCTEPPSLDDLPLPPTPTLGTVTAFLLDLYEALWDDLTS